MPQRNGYRPVRSEARVGAQNGAGVLAGTTGSIYAGAPRNVVAGMKLAF